MGWTVDTLARLFADYAAEVDALAEEYHGRITLLKGFEIEVVPPDRYAAVMRELRERHGFRYIVGSVHYVADTIIDYTPDRFAEAVRRCGGLEPMAVRYYEAVGEMVQALRPEVVGHLDLVRKLAPREAVLDTPAIRGAAFRALDAIAECGAILDVNTGGYRKGLGEPYPAPWLVAEALDRGIGFCPGDDSHRPGEVGFRFGDALAYLRGLGVSHVSYLGPNPGERRRAEIPASSPESGVSR